MYFANFPKIVYDFDLSNGTDYRVITDITKNVRFRKNILENITLYDYYDIADGETPEIISEKVYGTPYYHWVIMLANQRYDYINDFPLSQLELDTYLTSKYSYQVNSTQTIAPGQSYTTITSGNQIAFGASNNTVGTTWNATIGGTLSTGLVKCNTYVDQRYHIHDYKVDGFIKEGINTIVFRDSVIDGGGIGMLVPGKVLVSMINGYEARVDTITVNSNNINITIEASLRVGKFMPGETVKVRNEDTYVEVVSSTIPANYTTTSNYEYEFNLNESKRRIKIIDPILIEQIIKEFKDIL